MRSLFALPLVAMLFASPAMAQQHNPANGLDQSKPYVLATGPVPMLCGTEQLIRTYFVQLATGAELTVIDEKVSPTCLPAFLAIFHPPVQLYAQHGAFCQITFPYEPQFRGRYGWVICSSLVEVK